MSILPVLDSDLAPAGSIPMADDAVSLVAGHISIGRRAGARVDVRAEPAPPALAVGNNPERKSPVPREKYRAQVNYGI